MSAATPGSILFIDDDPQVLGTFKRVTRDLDARVRFAANAEEGWRMVQAEVPELIICDYRLPGQDGLTFLENIRANHPAVKGVLHTAEPIHLHGPGKDVPVLGKPCLPADLHDLIVAITAVKVLAPSQIPATPSPMR